MKWSVLILGILSSLLLVVLAVSLREKPPPPSVQTGNWAVTTAGCYVAVGTPTTAPPGVVCGQSPPAEKTYCEYRGQRYGIGERFAAGDGCNSCACDEGTKQVICTALVCQNNTNTTVDR